MSNFAFVFLLYKMKALFVFHVAFFLHFANSFFVSDISIVGAGINGLSTALALRNIAGINATVFEKRTATSQGEGTALTLWPNGLSALFHIDPKLCQTMLKNGTMIQEQWFVTSRDFTRKDTSSFSEDYGFPLLSVPWSLFHNALLHKVGNKNIQFGRECIDIETMENGICLHFADGTKHYTKHVLVCDGIHSTLRQRLVHDGPPRRHDRIIFRSIIPQQENMPHKTMFGSTKANPNILVHGQPCGNGSFYWAVVLRNVSSDKSDNREQRKGGLLDQLYEFPEMQRWVQGTASEDILEREVLDRPGLSTWRYAEDRVLLMGDAAHAMVLSIGQGANMCLEDSVQLALLARHEKNWPSVFRDYEKIRLPRCQKIQQQSANYGSAAYGTVGRKLGGYEESAWLLDFQPSFG